MPETSQPPVPTTPGGPAAGAQDAGENPGRGRLSRAPGPELLALAAVVAGTVLLGLLAGFIWQQVAPRALFVVVSRGAANVVDPETNAFIVADGWFAAVTVIGGVITGLLGYRLAVRRYGPLPMVGVLVGGVAAAYVARWLGERSGAAQFNARLAAARTGTLLRAPLTLGSHSALALWPLAAGLVAGGIEAAALLQDRQRVSGRHTGSAARPQEGADAAAGPGLAPSDPGTAGDGRPGAGDRDGEAGSSSRPAAGSWLGGSAGPAEADRVPPDGLAGPDAAAGPGESSDLRGSPSHAARPWPGQQGGAPERARPHQAAAPGAQPGWHAPLWREESPWPEDRPWPEERPWGGRPRPGSPAGD
jgi:hypothetical protein